MKGKILLILFAILLVLCLLGYGDTKLGELANGELVKEEETTIEDSSTEHSDEYIQGQEKANELIEEMESIDWEENYDNSREKGKEAAEFLNELLK